MTAALGGPATSNAVTRLPRQRTLLPRIVTLGTVLIVLSFVGAFAVGAQQTGRTVRIGLLWPLPASAAVPSQEAFVKGLRELGWLEGRNLVIERRFADGRPDRLPGLAAELVGRNVEMIMTGSTPGPLAAKHATRTIPVVMVMTGDPVAAGVTTSLAKPDANVTGITVLGTVLTAKRLELLKEAVPPLTNVVVLWNPGTPDTAPTGKGLEDAARALRVNLRGIEVRDPTEIEKAFTAMRIDRVGGFIVQPDILLDSHRTRIIELAATTRLPGIYPFREHVEMGGLMFYGANLANLWYRAATYVDKILRGAKPADLPIEQPTTFELVINRASRES